MKLLSRYIFKHVMSATLMVMLVLVALILMIGVLDELRDIGTGDYGFFQALLHVLLELPNNLYHFFPMIALLGAVLGLSLLSTQQALVVMQAAGYAHSKIIRMTLTASLVLIVLMSVVGEWVAPKSHSLAQKHKQAAENHGQAIATASGVWLHEGNNFINIAQVRAKRHLEGVTRYEFDRYHELMAAYYVKSMDFVNHQWVLHDEVKTTFADLHASSQQFAVGHWDLMLNPQLLSVGLTEPQAMTLSQLKTYAQHLSANGLQASEFQFEFWQRIFQPFATLMMILVTLPIVMKTSRTVATGWRVFVAVIVGFVFYILNIFVGQVSIVFQISPLLAALFPSVIFCISWLYFNHK